MTTKTYIGIDPGTNGAIAILVVVDKAVRNIKIFNMCKLEEALGELRGIALQFGKRDIKIWLEITSGWNPTKSPLNVAGLRKLDRSIGELKGCLDEMWRADEGVVEYIQARSWQKHFKQYAGSTAKERVRWYLEHIHPNWAKLCRGPRGAWKDGRADAIGIALACMWSDSPQGGQNAP